MIGCAPVMRSVLIALLVTAVGSAVAEQEGDVVQPSGIWCARFDSVNQDGYFSACVLMLTQARKPGDLQTRAFAWSEGTCIKSKNWCGAGYGNTRVADGPEQLNVIVGGVEFDGPQHIVDFAEGSPPQLLFTKRDGDVVPEGGEGPNEDPLVWERSADNVRPSFPCAKARQPREVAICASPSLSFLDQQLRVTFGRVVTCARETVKPPRTEAEIRQSQTQWWSDKLAHCHSAECVEPLYRERMAELNSMCPKH